MEPVKALGAFFSELSFRAWLGILAVLLVLGAGYYIFVASTGQLTYDRLERETELLADIQALGEHQSVTQDTLVGKAYDSLIVRYNRAVREDHGIGINIHPRLQQVLFALFPWILVGIAFGFVPGIRADTKQERISVVGGVGMVAVIFAILALLIPTSLDSWIRLAAIPWGGMLVIMVGFALWGRYK